MSFWPMSIICVNAPNPLSVGERVGVRGDCAVLDKYRRILAGAALAFACPNLMGACAMANDNTADLQSRVDTIVAECGYTGITTYKASGPNEITMSLDMAAFEKDGPEEGATAAAHDCVMQKLREIPNLSLGFTGNGQEK